MVMSLCAECRQAVRESLGRGELHTAPGQASLWITIESRRAGLAPAAAPIVAGGQGRSAERVREYGTALVLLALFGAVGLCLWAAALIPW